MTYAETRDAAMRDTLAAIDDATETRCGLESCREPLDPCGPSEYWCDDWCQAKWMDKQADNPREVYAGEDYWGQDEEDPPDNAVAPFMRLPFYTRQRGIPWPPLLRDFNAFLEEDEHRLAVLNAWVDGLTRRPMPDGFNPAEVFPDLDWVNTPYARYDEGLVDVFLGEREAVEDATFEQWLLDGIAEHNLADAFIATPADVAAYRRVILSTPRSNGVASAIAAVTSWATDNHEFMRGLANWEQAIDRIRALLPVHHAEVVEDFADTHQWTMQRLQEVADRLREGEPWERIVARERALQARRNRNTGPTVRQRGPNRIDPRGTR